MRKRGAPRVAHPQRVPATLSLRALATTVLVLALCLVALGGVVHTTGSSLACPDWPLCHGQVMPAMEGGVLYEHSHRLLALAVMIGVLVLPWAARRSERTQRTLAIIAVCVVVVQALLGAITVLLRLPPLVSVLHLGGATLLCALLVWIATREGARPTPIGPRTAATVRLALALCVCQVLLGAAVRHLGAAMACGRDLVACDGSWAPSHALGVLHLAHRALGLVTLVAAVRVGLALGRSPGLPRASRIAGALVGLAAPLQVGLGLLTVALGPTLVVVTAHLVLGELLVVGLVHVLASLRAPAREASTERSGELSLDAVRRA